MGLSQIACDRSFIVSRESIVAQKGVKEASRLGSFLVLGLEAKDNVLTSEPISQSFSISIA